MVESQRALNGSHHSIVVLTVVVGRPIARREAARRVGRSIPKLRVRARRRVVEDLHRRPLEGVLDNRVSDSAEGHECRDPQQVEAAIATFVVEGVKVSPVV